MTERFSVFRMILILTVVALAFYVLNATLRYSGWGWFGFILTIFWIFGVFGFALSQPLLFWGKEKLSDSPWVETIQFGGYLALHYVSDILTLIMIRDVVGFTLWGGAWAEFWAWDGWSLYSGEVSLLLLGLPVVFLLMGYLVVLSGPFVTKVKIIDERLPKELEGYRICQISDLHLGPMMKTYLTKRVLKKLRRLHFHTLVLTGDIVDCDPQKYPKRVQLLKELEAPHGVYYCPGNHEYYWGLNKILKIFENTAIKVLINQSIVIEKFKSARLRLFGVPDPISKYFQDVELFDWKKVIPIKDEQTYDILLAHRPEIASEAKELGYNLQLSGHTHAGQFFPWNYFIFFFQRYVNGLYELESKFSHERMHLYVNQGTGFWGPPTRLGTYAEITMIELVKSKTKRGRSADPEIVL